ncbi:hypothetical protein SKAU_G00143160 [Synaphobranchus kaupii]|uniref:Uncharacterized protein n=1 Tax=Synaphobranchus kaupii TaxID=118154 RepID=A0A9Q1FSM6_SYNKA|nr:hypothetical protein SKAU_G00143160 [Synaphobranchus kaupii]
MTALRLEVKEPLGGGHSAAADIFGLVRAGLPAEADVFHACLQPISLLQPVAYCLLGVGANLSSGSGGRRPLHR